MATQILCVGRIKSPWIAEGCEEYFLRLQFQSKCSLIELPASKEKTPERQREEESKRIIAFLKGKDADTWLLDEKGERKTSEQFSRLLRNARDTGQSLVFVIGGAYGVNDAMRKASKGVLRLSDMTLTHEMSRLFLLEQLYRAFEILKGSGYHH